MKVFSTQKPWGSFTRFTDNEPSTVKFLYITHGEEFSLQYHKNREEFWKIISGNPEVIVGETVCHPKIGDEFTIPPETLHRIFARVDDVVVLEISTGNFDEKDIVRVEDKYNRT